VLKTVELDEMRDSYARELSGGQQKLLELGRALMTDPDAILLDEPLAGVAPGLAPGLLDRIEGIAEDEDKPILGVEPWGSDSTSNYVKRHADRMVGWNTDSIVEAIRDLSP
jgi:ABC-type branched-subunit amino acid transport system ATPase component